MIISRKNKQQYERSSVKFTKKHAFLCLRFKLFAIKLRWHSKENTGKRHKGKT